MEEIKSSDFPARTIGQQASTPHLIVQALIFTGILYLTAGLTLPNNGGNTVSTPANSTASLWQSVTNAVLQDVSDHSGLPRSALRIAHAHQQTWPNDCLGVNDIGVLCTNTQIPGWQVTVVSGQKLWVYRTNASGTVVKLDAGTASNVQKTGV